VSDDPHDRVGIDRAVGRQLRRRVPGHRPGLSRSERFGQGVQSRRAILMRMCQNQRHAARWSEFARLVRIGEERDRRLRADENQGPGPLQKLNRRCGAVGQALDHDAACSSFDPWREGIADEACAGRRRNPARRSEAASAQAFAAQQQRNPFA
jgi:hypothetical protein